MRKVGFKQINNLNVNQFARINFYLFSFLTVLHNLSCIIIHHIIARIYNNKLIHYRNMNVENARDKASHMRSVKYTLQNRKEMTTLTKGRKDR